MDTTAILDVGKTNVKLCLLNETGDTVWSRSHGNTVIEEPYPHFDVDAIWQWFLAALGEANRSHPVTAINVSTHGACAVLVGAQAEPVLPVLDYEYEGVETCSDRYNALRPDFSQTCSPGLPGGLNLGRQLFWQRTRFPEEFAQCTHVLMYPQYWVWRLTGVAISEVTSLGCHTDLWCPQAGHYSALVDELDIREKLPPMVSATDVAGPVSDAVVKQAGLQADCRVYAGVHDSNASFARHLAAGFTAPFVVVSMGTWVISMAAGCSLDRLDESLDTLANVSVLGEPVACARFMGGREFEEICRLTGASVGDDCSEADVEGLIFSEELVTPAFAAGGGPFNGSPGRLPADVANGNALATLYLALMIDLELDLLGAGGDILLGSSSKKNPLLCRLLAQLRGSQRVLLSGDEASTVRGAWCLANGAFPHLAQSGGYVESGSTQLQGLAQYRDNWRRLLESPAAGRY